MDLSKIKNKQWYKDEYEHILANTEMRWADYVKQAAEFAARQARLKNYIRIINEQFRRMK